MAALTVSDVRAECPLITAGVRNDASITAVIAGAKGEVEAVLARDYDVTDISTDATAKRAWLDLTCALLWKSILGEKGWFDTAQGQAQFYYARWAAFCDAVVNRRVSLTLSRKSIGVGIYNDPLGTAAYSYFDLDSFSDYPIGEDSYD